MTRLVTIATACALVILVAAAVARATYREYGLEPAPRPQADCPADPCRATGRVTGFQAQVVRGDRVLALPTRVRRRNGWLVGFSLTLGNPTAEQIRFFNGLWGSPAKARVAVLRPAPVRRDRRNRRQNYRLVAQSEPYTLNPFFGKKAWFVLRKRMHVRKRDVIGITLPTWAPALATDLSGKERWRGSRRPGDCDNIERRSAHQRLKAVRSYRCQYTTARLLYTALVINKTPENR